MNLPKEEVDSKDHLNFEVTSELHSLFTFKISRNSTGTVIWDTSIGWAFRFFFCHFLTELLFNTFAKNKKFVK